MILRNIKKWLDILSGIVKRKISYNISWAQKNEVSSICVWLVLISKTNLPFFPCLSLIFTTYLYKTVITELNLNSDGYNYIIF